MLYQYNDRIGIESFAASHDEQQYIDMEILWHLVIQQLNIE